MFEDPIVTEVRQAGQELEEQAEGDLHKFFQHLRNAQGKYKERLVNHVPRLSPALEAEDYKNSSNEPSRFLSCGGLEMKQSKFLHEDKLVQQAIDALMEKLGPVETTRFLSLPFKKRIDSVKRHQIWQSRLEKESFFKDVFGS